MELESNGEIIHTETLLFALFLLFDERSMLIYLIIWPGNTKRGGFCHVRTMLNHSQTSRHLMIVIKRHLNRMSIDL